MKFAFTEALLAAAAAILANHPLIALGDDLDAGAQHLQVAAALAIDKYDGVVFFEARIQGAQRLHASRGRRNTSRIGINSNL